MMKQAQDVGVQPAHRVVEHREESNVQGKVWACVFPIFRASRVVALLVVRDLARDVDDELPDAA